MRDVPAIRTRRRPPQLLFLGERPLEEGRGGREDGGDHGIRDGVRGEVDEAGCLEAVKDGLGGLEALGGRAVEEEGKVDELRRY